MVCSFYESISSEELEDVLHMYDARNKLVHEGKGLTIKQVRKKMYSLLNIISKLLLNKPFKFPSASHGNVFWDVANWEKFEVEMEKKKS